MEKTKTVNTTIDYAKFIFAILVVGIHTEPFGFNFWLDKGFGIITRLCVPFFFVCSSYFFYIKEKNAFSYLRRLFLLFLIWSLIYLPFDLESLREKSIWEVVLYYSWDGPSHALWYLSGSLLGFIIVRCLLETIHLKKDIVFALSIVVLIIGCVITTYSPLVERLLSISINNTSDCRNGLFYAFPYMALGMVIAKYKCMKKDVTDVMIKDEVSNSRFRQSSGGYFIGFLISTLALGLESYYFVVILKTHFTILWITVLPMTYFFFMWLLKVKISRSKEKSLYLRRMSTLIFVSHGLFLMLFSKYFNHFLFFVIVTVSSVLFSHIIIVLSRNKYFAFLKYLY